MQHRWVAASVAGLVAVAGLAIAPQSQASPPVSAAELGCDPIDAKSCLLPFPSDAYTVADPTTATGRRVDFALTAMPQNVVGKPIDPTPWHGNDGFSPGSMLLAFAPGLDLHQTWGTAARPERERDHLADVARYEADDAPIVVINARTGQRHPFWSELDTHPGTTDADRLLIIRPAVNFTEGDRYLVGLRHLRDGFGSEIAAPATFADFRDSASSPLDTPALAERRAEVRSVIGELADAESGRGFEADDLYLAWDFTVASAENLAGPVLAMRDDAFGRILGDTNLADRVIEGASPEFTITKVTDLTVAQNAHTARTIEGTVKVPNYLDLDAEVENSAIPVSGQVALPGRRLYDPDGDGIPEQNPLQPWVEPTFTCHLPRTASAANPAHPLVYGHGLLGSRGEAGGGSTEDMRIRNFAICAMDWWGMSGADLVNVATILPDASNFASLVNRSLQGFVNKLFLARAFAHAAGFSSHPAFQDGSGSPLTEVGVVDYDGNSQGAIMGGSLVALSPDFQRGVLGVAGMNYSTLLNRSVDWEGLYAIPFYAAYPNKAEQQIVFALMQMLWDRAETNGYAAHATADPYPNTPSHQIMLQLGFDDHQVANVSAEVEARTMGAAVKTPMLPDAVDATGSGNGLHWSVDPTFGLSTVTFGAGGVWRDGSGEDVLGSVLVYWFSADNGNDTPPNGNVPPTTGGDPHEHPRRDNAGSDQKAEFLRTGRLIDVCGGGPCITSAASRAN